MTTINAGDTVRLKRRGAPACPEGRDNHRTAVVKARLSGTYAGGLYMERDLRGCRYWNEAEVVVVSASSAQPRARR